MNHKQKINILGIPMDLGQDRRGVDMGPTALRYAGLQKKLTLLGYQVCDSGNIIVPNLDRSCTSTAMQRIHTIATVCEAVYEWGRQIDSTQAITLYLGGDHSISIGSVKAVANPDTTGIIWIDAHADFNTPQSSPSGNIHGMPVAVLTGDGLEVLTRIGDYATVPAKNIVQIGTRDVDLAEQPRLLNSDVTVFTIRQVDACGITAAANQALKAVAHCDTLHVSLDLDVLDPVEAPGVGTQVNGGLTYREAQILMETLGNSGKVRSADIVEVNPILDHGNQTAELAVELIASLLGKRILGEGQF